MKVRSSLLSELELSRRQKQRQAKSEKEARQFVFDASPANQKHIRIVMDMVASSRAPVRPAKEAFLDAICRVALGGRSIVEASEQFNVPPRAIHSVLANISERTPEQTYKYISATLRYFSKPSKQTDATQLQDNIALQPTAASPRRPAPIGAPSPSRPVSPQLNSSAFLAMTDTSFPDALGLEDFSALAQHASPRPMLPQPEALPASAMMDTFVPDALEPVDFAAIAEHFNLDGDLVELLKFDPYVDMPSVNQAPQLAPAPQRAPSTPPQTAPSAVPQAQHATPSSSEHVSPARPAANVAPRAPDVSQAVSLPPTQQSLASVRASPGAAAAQNYLSQHPGDARVVFTTKHMINAAHKEFVAIAGLSGYRVHAHKTSLFHAMVDTCQNVPLIAAAASKFVAPEALLGAMHALHATSPIDTFQWLCSPSTQSSLHPPGSDIVVTIKDLPRPHDAKQLAPHRFDPHAQTYQQHPLPAAPQAMWRGNLVGAQPIPRY